MVRSGAAALALMNKAPYSASVADETTTRKMEDVMRIAPLESIVDGMWPR